MATRTQRRGERRFGASRERRNSGSARRRRSDGSVRQSCNSGCHATYATRPECCAHIAPVMGRVLCPLRRMRVMWTLKGWDCGCRGAVAARSSAQGEGAGSSACAAPLSLPSSRGFSAVAVPHRSPQAEDPPWPEPSHRCGRCHRPGPALRRPVRRQRRRARQQQGRSRSPGRVSSLCTPGPR